MKPFEFNIDNVHMELGPYDTKYKAYKIRIYYNNCDNNRDKLIIHAPVMFTYGIQENKSSGFSLPLVCNEMTKPFIDVIERIENKCKEFLRTKDIAKILNKANLNVYTESMTTLYRKMVDGIPCKTSSPILYARLRTSFKDPAKITTAFYQVDSVNQEIIDLDCQSLGSARFKCMVTLEISSIYCGTKPSLQIRANTVIVGQQYANQSAGKCDTHLYTDISQDELESLFEKE